MTSSIDDPGYRPQATLAEELQEMEHLRLKRRLERDLSRRRLNTLTGALAVVTLGASALIGFLRYAGLISGLDLSVEWERFLIGAGCGAMVAFALMSPLLQWLLVGYPHAASTVRTPGWADLRRTGGEQLKRASFVVLASVPLLAYAFIHNPLQIDLLRGATFPLGLKLSFFASFLIVAGSSIANAMGPRDEDTDPDADLSRPALRVICWACYLNAFWLAVVISIRAALLVTRA